ncbi:MAG: DUF1573 domain-containing protein [Zavarzinella sp.]
MLRSLFVCLSVVTVISHASAGSADTFFDEKVKNFGRVGYGPILEHDFRLTNTTNQTISISSAAVSCGCVSATIPVNSLRPGESTYVHATMDTKRFIGFKEVSIYVRFGNPRAEVTLKVQATRDDTVLLEQKAVQAGETLQFGVVHYGEEAKGTLDIAIPANNGLKILDVDSETSFVSATASVAGVRDGKAIISVQAKMTRGLDTGTWGTKLRVKTNHPQYAEIVIPAQVEIISSITAVPSSVRFPDTRVGQQQERLIIVKGTEPFKIMGVRNGNVSIVAQADTTQSKERHLVRLIYNPKEAGSLNQAIELVTDQKDTSITIPVSGTATKE